MKAFLIGFLLFTLTITSAFAAPVKSKETDPTKPAYFNNHISNPQLTDQGRAVLRNIQGAINPDGTINTRAVQVSLNAGGTSLSSDNNLGLQTAAALNAVGAAKNYPVDDGIDLTGYGVAPATSTYLDTSQSTGGQPSGGSAGAGTSSTPQQPSTVIVTEKIPGADCVCAIDNRDSRDIRGGMTLDSQCGDPATRKYKCTIQPGFSSFQKVLAAIIRYVVYTSMLLGVLALTVMGILWSIAGADEPKVKAMKGWFINIIIGLTILFFFRVILSFLAPWIFQ